MVFDHHASTLDIVGFTEGVAERGRVARHASGRPGVQEPDHRHRRLLRARRERPSRNRTADERYEFAALHSITSSARAMSVGGTVRPRALAVLRLMTNSNLVGCTIGKLFGFSPARIRPAYCPAVRSSSVKVAP
jgi:hypothetical protein